MTKIYEVHAEFDVPNWRAVRVLAESEEAALEAAAKLAEEDLAFWDAAKPNYECPGPVRFGIFDVEEFEEPAGPEDYDCIAEV